MTKKIILIIFLFFINITFFWTSSFAAPMGVNDIIQYWNSEYWSWKFIMVTVQEPIPWMDCIISPKFQENCTCDRPVCNKQTDLNCKAFVTYECLQEKWFWSLKTIIWTFIKFLTYLVWIVWVLYLVINWIMLSMSWFGSGMKENVKKGIMQAILGIIVLFLWWFILTQIAPWIFGV